MTEEKRLSMKIHGMVQGVGMRHFIMTQAKKLGIKGYVRNLSDGSVECVAEGEKKTLNRFVRIIEDDSPGQVDRIDKEESKKKESFKDFSVRY